MTITKHGGEAGVEPAISDEFRGQSLKAITLLYSAALADKNGALPIATHPRKKGKIKKQEVRRSRI
jgi:hypothetical protein